MSQLINFIVNSPALPVLFNLAARAAGRLNLNSRKRRGYSCKTKGMGCLGTMLLFMPVIKNYTEQKIAVCFIEIGNSVGDVSNCR